MIENGCVLDSITYGALIDRFCKENKVEEAHTLFDEMLKRELVPYEVTFVTLINEYSKRDKFDSVLEVLDRVDKKPRVCTFNNVIRKHCNEGKMDYGKNVFI